MVSNEFAKVTIMRKKSLYRLSPEIVPHSRGQRRKEPHRPSTSNERLTTAILIALFAMGTSLQSAGQPNNDVAAM